VIVVTTVLHAFDLRVSRDAQNLLVAVKVVLVVGFVVLGVAYGSSGWPRWKPAAVADGGGGGIAAFMGHLVWVAYAYTGWNAAAYAAGDFRDPRRTVPRAMVIGCALVAALYLAVNWVFVANLTPALVAEFVAGESGGRITLGHVIARVLAGETAAAVMSGFVVLSLLSTISAMTFVGPRIYAAMAADGYLPRAFRAEAGRPPTFSVLLQGAIALALFLTHSFDELVENVGAILSLTSALTVATLFRVRFGRTSFERPSAIALLSAALYIALAALMLYYALARNPSALVWMAVVAAATLLGRRLRFR
jgi:APA family basic amino acid/polyamine antiporter